MQHLYRCPCGSRLSPMVICISSPGKVLRVVELNHMLHRLCGPPSIPLSFSLATVLPRRNAYRVNFGTEALRAPTSSIHRLGPGLPGYLIPFAPLAFVSQCQLQSRTPPSPPVFLQISTHFTATPGIPRSSPALKLSSIRRSSPVKLRDFTSDLVSHLQTLYAQ